MSNKTLTEKERELLKELRQHPLEAEEIIETLSIKEIQSLYSKVDIIQEEEGKSKLYSGVLDEGYIFEWSRVKNTLLLEHSKRTQIMQMRRKKLVVIELLLFFKCHHLNIRIPYRFNHDDGVQCISNFYGNTLMYCGNL